jgi:hypothetical protein
MAACVLALAVGVGVGQAQEKPAVAVPPPAPKVLYIPPVPPAYPLLNELAGLEAVGCKVCVEAAEAKSKPCACSEACGSAKKTEGCAKCAENKKGCCASGTCDDCCATKKVKKRKKVGTQDFFMIAAPPPPPMPMMPPTAPVTIYSSTPIAACPAPVCMPTPAEPMMVFRACNRESAAGCAGVQQAKHEHGGKFEIDINLGLAKCSVPVMHTSTAQLEIECGSQCKATCEQMTLHVPGGKQLAIATAGKQVVLIGPALKATCDSLMRCGVDGGLCLMLQGHVHLHHGKDGMKADIDSEQVRLVIHDGMVEVHTVTTP